MLLVRAGYEQDYASIRRQSVSIASAILTGARDRARQAPLRTLLDQQRRSEPLSRKRSPHELPVSLPRSHKVAA